MRGMRWHAACATRSERSIVLLIQQTCCVPLFVSSNFIEYWCIISFESTFDIGTQYTWLNVSQSIGYVFTCLLACTTLCNKCPIITMRHGIPTFLISSLFTFHPLFKWFVNLIVIRCRKILWITSIFAISYSKRFDCHCQSIGRKQEETQRYIYNIDRYA